MKTDVIARQESMVRIAYRMGTFVPTCSAAGGYGTFDVGSRFIWVRHIPITPKTCIYN